MQLKIGKVDKRLGSSLCMFVVLFCLIYGGMSTPVWGVSMRGVIQNPIRPIAIYVIDTRTNRVVSGTVMTHTSGVFELGRLPAAEYAMVFRVQLDPQFPLDYVEAVVPSVALIQDTDFGAVGLTFFNDYTVFSGIVDAHLGLTDLDNLDNLDTMNGFNEGGYVENWPTQRDGTADVNGMDANTSSGTPYGAGNIW
jgi:hypothetical protein|tara:strand:- start:1 stop:585 length:585 start_codon:yes stop_codon:yes gene_type:complete